MITYNNIINRLEQFATSNVFLKSFTHGSPASSQEDKFKQYPTMHALYTGATYDGTSKEYSFDLYILDYPADKADKQDFQAQAVSNCEQVAEDILADIRNGHFAFTETDFYEVTSAVSKPLEDTTSNALSGILLSISIEVGNHLDACNSPLNT